MSPGPEPLGGEWEAVADRLEPFTRLPMTVGRKGTARYAMAGAPRAWPGASICVGCLLSEEGDRKAARLLRQGLRGARSGEPPGGGGGHRDRMARARADARDAGAAVRGAELIGAHDPSLYPRSGRWNRAYARGRRLAEFCPWGAKTYAALAEYGVFGGRLAILDRTRSERGAGREHSWPDRSLLDYFTGYGRKYFWSIQMRWGPSSIGADFRHSNRESSSTAAAK